MKAVKRNNPNRSKQLHTPMQKSLEYSTLQEVARLIRRQKVSPVEVVEACLKRIEELNPELNAFITVLADRAREQARAAEAESKSGKWRGPLHGIPVGIKDFYDTAGIKTTAGFEHFKDRIPAKDAAGVFKLKKAGAVIIGKMNMHQLGMGTTGLESYFGPVHNPWDPEYIPGGSSSGSAAAVASGMCYATLDTDAIGSCRLPAACCGVVGFKGTYGLISPKGILEGEKADEMILWLSHPAITTRSVQDTAIVLDVLAEPSENRKTTSFARALARNRKLRIGVANNYQADQETKAAFERAVKTIRSLGYPRSRVAAPFRDPSSGIDNIEADRKSIARQAFKDIDVLILPTTTTAVPTIKEVGANPQALSPENTAFANYYGLPAISVLCGFDTNGLPLGLQIVGKPWGESAVLRLAYQYQAGSKYSERHP
ncbi:MAG TPA: amidase [Anaerolineales bacterium]|nr:amidase [Anaerolineales bacterium]HLO33313.1 amidase [Anaerolineales bacterium]